MPPPRAAPSAAPDAVAVRVRAAVRRGGAGVAFRLGAALRAAVQGNHSEVRKYKKAGLPKNDYVSAPRTLNNVLVSVVLLQFSPILGQNIKINPALHCFIDHFRRPSSKFGGILKMKA